MNAILLLPLGVVLLNVYALALVCLRRPLFGGRLYRPMLLNIGLSVLPALVLAATVVGLLLIVTLAPSFLAVWAVIVAGGLAWLVGLPNAGYLVTELNFSHRRPDDVVPLWYDIVLVITLAMSGVMNTLFNVVLAQFLLAVVAYPDDPRPFARAGEWVLAGITLTLVSMGIYLGRYIRFNTWDLRHPVSFARKLHAHFREPGRVRTATGFVVAHTLFFAILYLVVVAPAILAVELG